MNTKKLLDQAKFNTHKIIRILEKLPDLELLQNLSSIHLLIIIFQAQEHMMVNSNKPKANHPQLRSLDHKRTACTKLSPTISVLVNTPTLIQRSVRGVPGSPKESLDSNKELNMLIRMLLDPTPTNQMWTTSSPRPSSTP